MCDNAEVSNVFHIICWRFRLRLCKAKKLVDTACLYRYIKKFVKMLLLSDCF
jgi:hypothetical protein